MNSTLNSAIDVSRGHRFFGELTEQLSADGPIELHRLRAVAQYVAENPTRFLSWLKEILQDGVAMRVAAARSYWHPNGFAKLVLHTSAEPEFRIRLHVWPLISDEPPAGESNPHSHRWEFASTVLAGGGLHMEEFEETTRSGKLFDRYRYGADPANRAALLSDGAVRLKRVAAPHVRRGAVYQCDTDVVHTVRPIEAGLTATVVIQGPRRVRSTVVYCEPGQSDDQPNGMLTEEQFRWLLKSVVAEAGA